MKNGLLKIFPKSTFDCFVEIYNLYMRNNSRGSCDRSRIERFITFRRYRENVPLMSSIIFLALILPCETVKKHETHDVKYRLREAVPKLLCARKRVTLVNSNEGVVGFSFASAARFRRASMSDGIDFRGDPE